MGSPSACSGAIQAAGVGGASFIQALGFCDSKVGEIGFAALIKENIGGFNIPVNESVMMGFRDGPGDDLNKLRDFPLLFSISWFPFAVCEGPSRHPATGNEEKSPVFSGRKNGNDGRVFLFSQCLCFSHEMGSIRAPAQA